MSAVVLVFALNLFGVFEINLPQWLSRRAVAAEGSMHGDAGSFFQGVFATVLATPCTAPFLGTALGFAFTQSADGHFAHVRLNRAGNERALFSAQRTTGLAQIFAQARARGWCE